MGAYDCFAARLPCPACGDLHEIDGQTKFFDPDYDDQRYFRPGLVMPATFTAAEIPGLARDGWLRMRPPTGDADHIALLADFDDLYVCTCGHWLGIVLHFALAPGTVTLVRIEILDAREDIAARCDYVDAASLWPGNAAGFDAAIAALEARPFPERAAWLRARLDERFAHDPFDDALPIVGPTQCEACGHVRERTHPYWSPSFFEPRWTGALYLGTRVPFDERWLAEDVDRGGYFRGRHPVAETALTLLGWRMPSGCPCGAGRARCVARFERSPGALTLVELALRVVRTPEDLRDIDFIDGPTRDGQHTREHLRGWVLR